MSEPGQDASGHDPQEEAPAAPDPDAVERFWQVARVRGRLEHPVPSYFGQSALGALQPPALSFGATRAEADEALAAVLDGTRTETSVPAGAYAAAGEPLPEVGALGIVTDGAGVPRALVATTEVREVRSDDGADVVVERFRVVYASD